MKLFACLGTCALLFAALVATSDAGEHVHRHNASTHKSSNIWAGGFWSSWLNYHSGCCDTSIGCKGRHEHLLLDKACPCKRKARKSGCGCGGRKHKSCGRPAACGRCGNAGCGGCGVSISAPCGDCGGGCKGKCRRRTGRLQHHLKHRRGCDCNECCAPVPPQTIKRRAPRASFTYTPTSGLSESGVPRMCRQKIVGVNPCRTTRRGCNRRRCNPGCTMCVLGLHQAFVCSKGNCGGCKSHGHEGCSCGGDHAAHDGQEIIIEEGTPNEAGPKPTPEDKDGKTVPPKVPSKKSVKKSV